MTIVEFLTARLDDRERGARELLAVAQDTIAALKDPRFLGCEIPGWHSWRDVEATCHGVLREVEAMRAIVAMHAPAGREPETDEQMHARCANPAWDYATTSGQRKAWDGADDAPDGDGWERNTARGNDGWERFDYTEESYWRRPRGDGERPEPAPPLALRHLAGIWSDHDDCSPAWKPDAGIGEAASGE
jgi:hypothetical protein